jgi:hypothetical protein
LKVPDPKKNLTAVLFGAVGIGDGSPPVADGGGVLGALEIRATGIALGEPANESESVTA